jgi:ferrous iron transport protein B
VSQNQFHVQGLTLALVGNPNCGKTTIFNAVTGANQLVGNWSGVTVQAKQGCFRLGQQDCCLVDLPGIYSLVTHHDASNDEKATWNYLNQGKFDAIICVLDAHHLERSLYLALQCIEFGKPVILALNRVDVAEHDGLYICPLKLSQMLHCPVIPICARKNAGLSALLSQTKTLLKSNSKLSFDYFSTKINNAWKTVQSQDVNINFFQFITNIECEQPTSNQAILQARKNLSASIDQDLDIHIAQSRYQHIDNLKESCCSKKEAKSKWGIHLLTSWLDKWVCHRVIGVPIFFFVMYSLFFFAINIGGIFQAGIEIIADGIFVTGLFEILQMLNLPNWILHTITSGVGKGISTVLTFVPVLAAMFFALAFLQDSGYMARAAFVMDRVMRSIGLPGKSFVPMIVGFGCNVPAILGTRALDHRKERILTVMMSPFMSCGARLAIFTVFVATFFPQGGENIIFLLYMIGIAMAVVTGLILKKTLLKGAPTPFLLDMPDYQLPHLPGLCKQAFFKTKKFVKDALKLVIPVCMLLAAMNHITFSSAQDAPSTLLEKFGQTITPIFSPMGITQDNWPASVGLLTGVMAKEVVIGSLNTLYLPIEEDNNLSDKFNLKEIILDSLIAMKDSFIKIFASMSNPIAAKAPTQSLDNGVHNIMLQKFASQTAAFAYLLFVLLYVPCVSVIAAMVKEVNIKWTLFSGFWTTSLAYGTSVIYYQTMTFSMHPVSSAFWIISLSACLVGFIACIRVYSKNKLVQLPTQISVRVTG